MEKSQVSNTIKKAFSWMTRKFAKFLQISFFTRTLIELYSNGNHNTILHRNLEEATYIPCWWLFDERVKIQSQQLYSNLESYFVSPVMENVPNMDQIFYFMPKTRINSHHLSLLPWFHNPPFHNRNKIVWVLNLLMWNGKEDSNKHSPFVSN